MKQLIKYAMFASLCAVANAATLNVSRGSGNPGIIAAEQSVDGTTFQALTTGGYYIATGTFTNALGNTVEPSITTEFSSLLAAVSQFDIFAVLTSPVSGATTGTITGSFTSLGAPDTSVFNLKPIYFLIGNKATAAASTQWGIFKVAAGTSFPVNVGAAGSTTVSLPNGTAITPLANAGSVNANNFRLVGVPETSTSLLGALGALALLRRRRN